MPPIFCWPLVEVKRKILFHFKREHIFLDFLDFPIFVLDAHTDVPFSRLWGFLLLPSGNTRIMFFQILKVMISFLLESQQHRYHTTTFLFFFSSICIKLSILRYRCSGEENSSLLSSLYTNSRFRFICFIYIPVFLYKEFSSLFGSSNSAQKCTHKPLSRVSFSLPVPASNANPYRMLKQSEGSTKRKRP